jgi:hypothetical protein
MTTNPKTPPPPVKHPLSLKTCPFVFQAENAWFEAATRHNPAVGITFVKGRVPLISFGFLAISLAITHHQNYHVGRWYQPRPTVE